MIAIACPHCQQTKPVIKHGVNRSGTTRCLCQNCKRAFTLNPKPKTLTPEKRDLILRCLEERTSIRGVCRTAKASPNTVYSVLEKKSQNSLP